MADKDAMHYPRVMVMDETNRKMFLENSVRMLSSYENELKNIYLIYIDENYWALTKQGRLLLTHREV